MEKPGGQKTFGTSISFDLELPAAKKSRRKKTEEAAAEPAKAPQAGDIDCPGCSHTISNEAWLDALVGFVSGAKAYDMGEQVTGNVVQTLRNTVSNMELPQPRDLWELSIVSRLSREFEMLLEEGLEQKLSELGELYTRQEVEAYGEQVQQKAFLMAEQQLAEQIETDLRASLEQQLRREIEQELWKQFDAELARRTQQD